jgi:hypothetical protein
MVDAEHIQASLTYCRRCGYALVGLTQPRCPECGHAFDPHDPRTVARRPDQWHRSRRNRRAGIVLGLLAAVLLSSYAWLYVGWRSERHAIAAVLKLGGRAKISRLGPTWVGRLYMVVPLDFLRNRVSHVNLAGKPVTDRDLDVLGAFSHVRDLYLQETRVTGEGMAWIRRLRHLEFINLADTPVTDDAAAHLKHLTQLRELNLNRTKVTDAGLAELRGLTGMTALCLDGTQITDAGLAHLQDMAHLRLLTLSDTAITDVGLAHVSRLTGLWQLRLHNTAITDQGVAALRNIKALRTLDLSGTAVTDGALVHLRGMNTLSEVVLYKTRVDPEAADQLRQTMPRNAVVGP